MLSVKNTPLIRSAILTSVVSLISVVSAVGQTDVYLFGGQSNMNKGIAEGFKAEMAKLDPNAVVWTPRYRNPGVALDSGWSGNNWKGDPPGPHRKNFYGGTGPSDPNIGKAYDKMLATWRRVIGRIEGDYEIKAVFWVQGEQDSKHAISANRYAENLDHLITRIYSDLELDRGLVPFFYSSMESNKGGFKHRKALRAQQLAADSDSGDALSIANAHRVDASGLNYRDGVHYTKESLKELGQRFAQAYQND